MNPFAWARPEESVYVQNDATGVIRRRYPKRDKSISARQWRKLRRATREADKKAAKR